MLLNRFTDIDRLALRPKGGAFEPKKDCFGRDSFCMPEVRSLSALATMPEDDPAYRFRLDPVKRSTAADHRAIIT